MDGYQFDDLLRTLARSRRAAIVTLVGVAASMAGLPAAEGKKKKKKCRGCPACKECVKGKCRPLPDRSACGGVCDECRSGQCVAKANGTSCGGTDQCRDGVCTVRPDCISAGVSGCIAVPNCCSGVCGPGSGGICTIGASGRPCKVNGDCTSGQCVGYRCL